MDIKITENHTKTWDISFDYDDIEEAVRQYAWKKAELADNADAVVRVDLEGRNGDCRADVTITTDIS